MQLTASYSVIAAGNIKDVHGEEWTKEELQTLVNHLGSFTKAAARLGLNGVKLLRDAGVQSPAEFLREKAEKDHQWLPRYVLMHGSVALAAKHLNMSESFLRGILSKHGYDTRPVLPDRNEALKALQKFGSVLYVARHFHTTVAVIKKLLPEEWRDLQDPTKVGQTSIRTGTIAERYFEAIRQGHITESPATKNRNHPGWDYLDDEYGRVNVKSTPLVRERWTFEIDPSQDCDQFALVQLDAARSPVGLVMLPKSQLYSPPPHLRALQRADGSVAVVADQQFTVSSDPDRDKPPVAV